MTAETGTWLRQQRESRSWPRREMARRLIQAATAAGDTAPGITSVCCRETVMAGLHSLVGPS